MAKSLSKNNKVKKVQKGGNEVGNEVDYSLIGMAAIIILGAFVGIVILIVKLIKGDL